MRNLLAFCAAAALSLVGVGWYLDWFHVRTGTPTADGHENVNIDINGVKIAHDVHKGVEKGEKKLQEILDKHGQTDTANLPDAAKIDFARKAPAPTSGDAKMNPGPDVP